MFAGSIAIMRAIKPMAAQNVVRGTSRPIAPASSAMPVISTSTSGRGKAGGTIAMRSFFIGVKCDAAVKKNMVDSAARALTVHESSAVTPASPSIRYSPNAAHRTMSTATRVPVLVCRFVPHHSIPRDAAFQNGRVLVGSSTTPSMEMHSAQTTLLTLHQKRSAGMDVDLDLRTAE